MDRDNLLDFLKKLLGFNGLRPGNISAELAEMLENGSKNPFTNRSYSSRYRKILKERRKLPIYAQRQKFLDMVHEHQIVLLVGETGSGKTTQIPQYLAFDKLPHLEGKMIACTQPRRVAATSVARRVADEMDVELGEEVGYSIRFEDCTNSNTFVKYTTDGSLFREAMFDPLLSKYAAVVLDEVHERSLNVDILMALLKDVCKKRKDLTVVIMSATLDAAKFQKYFDNAPLLEVVGRAFPVDIHYSEVPDHNYLKASIRTALNIHLNEPAGDILIFLTGEGEIEDAVNEITEEGSKLIMYHGAGPLKVVPLYASLSPYDQQQIFESAPEPLIPGGASGRKIIVSTNIAQTSLTIDGIVYVIDSGYSKQSVYNPRTRVQSLQVSRISKASAKQRAGRAGRTRPGKAFRLYTQKEFDSSFYEQPCPDILRSNLGNTVLQLLKFGIEDLLHFDFMDAPSPEMLMDALEFLRGLGAVDNSGKITSSGDLMSCFPLDPQLSKMLISSSQHNCTEEILSLAALLSVPPIFIRPKKWRKNADMARAKFIHPDGDHLTLLNVYQAYKANFNDLSWCHENFVNHTSLELADDIRAQLKHAMKKQGLDIVQEDVSSRDQSINIRKVITSGFFMQVAFLHYSGDYLIVKDRQMAKLHPSSSIKHKPGLIVYNELVMTRRNYIRTCIQIEPEWLLASSADYYNSTSVLHLLR